MFIILVDMFTFCQYLSEAGIRLVSLYVYDQSGEAVPIIFRELAFSKHALSKYIFRAANPSLDLSKI